MASISSNHGRRYGAVLVFCLVLVSAVGVPIAMPTATAQGQTQSHGQQHQHTLVISHVSGSPSWSLTASGSIQLDTKTTERTDSVGGTTATGSVGGLPWETNASDPSDVIYYTGELLQFDLGGDGHARVTLDGKRVAPQTLKNTPSPTPSPSPTAISTPAPTARSSPTAASTIAPTASPSPEPSPTIRSPSPSPRSSPSSPSSSGVIDVGFVLGLAGGLVLIVVCGALLALLQ
jgi:cell division septation protein DedD